MKKNKEAVDHPAHYGGDVPHEVWKCLDAWGLVGDAYLWNAVKYISRAGKKDPKKALEDLKKARWYLQRRIDALETASFILSSSHATLFVPDFPKSKNRKKK